MVRIAKYCVVVLGLLVAACFPSLDETDPIIRANAHIPETAIESLESRVRAIDDVYRLDAGIDRFDEDHPLVTMTIWFESGVILLFDNPFDVERYRISSASDTTGSHPEHSEVASAFAALRASINEIPGASMEMETGYAE